MTTDQVIALGASVGACFSALATFLTIRQMAKQREASYRPELVIPRVYFDARPNPENVTSLATDWVNKYGTSKNGKYEKFEISLINIGLGAVKSVSTSWSFQVNDAVKQLTALAYQVQEPIWFLYNNGALHIDSEGSKSVSIWKNQNNTSIDYILPIASNFEAGNLILPHTYICIVAALVKLSLKTSPKQNKSFLNPPVINVSFSFLDIGSKKHSISFDIVPHLIMAKENGEFSGYLEASKSEPK